VGRLEAFTKDDAHVAVFALDALARHDPARAPQLLAAADARMASASHFIAERDRVDADAARRTPAAR